MGSVLISDVASDTAHFPHTMLGGQTHETRQPQRPVDDPIYPAATPSHPSSRSYVQPPPAAPAPAPLPTPSAAPQAQVQSSYLPQHPPQYAPPADHAQIPYSRVTTQPAPLGSGPMSQNFASQQYLMHPAQSAELYGHSSGSHGGPRPPPSMPLGADSTASPPSTSSRTMRHGSASSPQRIKVRDLSHIQSFATEEFLLQSRATPQRSQSDKDEVGYQYEISGMPVADIIEMVAGLLTKITTTNDRQHEHLHRHIPPPEGTTGLSQQTTSVLAFHGKNVPSITILSYLSRIHKYCPTTYEVFLSLLVYFDRMTERVNSGPTGILRQRQSPSRPQSQGGAFAMPQSGAGPGVSSRAAAAPTPPAEAFRERDVEMSGVPPSPSMAPESYYDSDPFNLSHFFVVDSFNIHRLVIAGVTCASKFFSDVFYTNSRYAKVGGLPLVELNHLELQFLILNDFRLSVPVETLEAYGTMLVEFYAREIVEQRQGEMMMEPQTPTPP
ncbi:MAG: hypothetical protein M1819_004416 [Sarea resinae]|nr:MAG: hypothetical protein M1819_004416 [Sarea resinae]